MIPGLIARLIALGVPPALAKPLLGIVAALALLGALWGAKCAYDASVVDRYTAKQQVQQAKRERTADTNLNIQKGRDEAAAQQRREEVDNATRNIPDQAPSARQHIRACLELRRQAKAHGRAQPAC